MNISRLAEQLKMTPKELLAILPEVGFHIGGRAQKVNDNLVDKILIAVKRHQKLQALKDKESEIKEIRGGASKTGVREKSVTLPETIIVKDLAEALSLPIPRVMAEMMKNGIMASLNERLDFATASIISEDLGFTVTKQEAVNEDEEATSKKELLQNLLSLRTHVIQKPPVVVVMGHVDHGKTKLLDAIRRTNVVAGEAGGITQHIGAYQAEVAYKGQHRLITFLDTPGHEAFKAMRSRGGQIADVAILVVAADDGLKPQTLESIAIIQKENIPFIVAVNKIDKEGADIERVKKELAEINLAPEEWGGKTVLAQISALKGQGIAELLELIVLMADLEDLKADPTGAAIGTIIESHVDKGEGPVATVLIQAGTLTHNDLLIVGPAAGKVKALKDFRGEDVTEATPGMPVKILGLKDLPAVGEILTVVTDRIAYNEKLKNISKTTRRVKTTGTVEHTDAKDEKAIPSLNLILRADVLGSLEALEASLLQLNSEEAQFRIIKKGLGFVNEADILTAQATNALIVGLHLKENRAVTSLATERKVILLHYDVIYHALEHLKKQLDSIKQKEVVREFMGKIKLLAIFKVAAKLTVCGGKITEGIVRKGAKIKILRGEELRGFGELTNLQSSRENVTEAAAPNEVGLEIACDPILELGDTLEFFVEK